MQVCDASSMIHAWDNYPVLQFPGLWEWIAVQIEQKMLVMPNVASAEVASKTPECADWLKKAGIELLDINNAVVQDAMRIKGLLGIVGDHYHPKGVGENDILIIAIARAHAAELVSEEQRQTGLPKIAAKKKIPTVCSMKEVAVPCINFIDYIRRSGVVFR